MVHELCFAATQRLEAPLSDLLSGAGSMGVVVEGVGGRPVVSASSQFDRCRYKGYFAEPVNRPALELAVRFLLLSHGEPGDCEMHWTALAASDWQEGWKRHSAPMFMGDNLLVLPSWLPMPEGAGERLVIRMDPEMAFGSGGHATTRGCLEVLEALAAHGPLGDVLDMGTGSGILLIGAMLLGAQSGLGIDPDPLAVAACERNCRVNLSGLAEMETRVGFRQDDQLPPGPFQTVVANILAPVLTTFLTSAPVRFHHCVAPGGHLVLSGLLTSQAAKLAACAAGNGFVHRQRRDIDEWSVLLLQRRQDGCVVPFR